MPLYEYRCQNCGYLFEKMVSFSQSNKLPECPTCKSPDTRKQLSTFASKGSSTSSSTGCSSTGRFT
jgi:putative FmdB family regulatory protein